MTQALSQGLRNRVIAAVALQLCGHLHACFSTSYSGRSGAKPDGDRRQRRILVYAAGRQS